MVTTTMCASGTLLGWTRLCRPSDPSSPVSGEYIFWEQRGTSTQLPNMWLISFTQTSIKLPVPKCKHIHKHTHLLSFIEPCVHYVTSSRFIQNEPFRSRWWRCVCVCLCVFCLPLKPSSKITFFFLFLGTSGLSWSRFPLINRRLRYI